MQVESPVGAPVAAAPVAACLLWREKVGTRAQCVLERERDREREGGRERERERLGVCLC